MIRLALVGITLMMAGNAFAQGKVSPREVSIPDRIVQADIVVVGRIVALEPKDVEAILSVERPYKLDYRIAVVKVQDVIHGQKDVKELRLGFVSPDQDRGVDKTGKNMPSLAEPQFRSVKIGEDGLFFLRRHHQGNFFVNFVSFNDGFLPSSDAPEFAKILANARRVSKVLEHSLEALKSDNLSNRYLAAVMLVKRYRPSGDKAGKLPERTIDAEESKLILRTLAEADWRVDEGVGSIIPQNHPFRVFLSLGVTKADGYDPPANDFRESLGYTRSWLLDNQEKYRIKRFVQPDGEKKAKQGADDPQDKKAELKKAVENADVILVGKVTKTGLVAASSFDVGEIEASKVLKGDEKVKWARFRFSGRMVPSYAKVGVEGVWILSKADNKPGWRNVLSFQPIAEEETVKALIKEEKKKGRQGQVEKTELPGKNLNDLVQAEPEETLWQPRPLGSGEVPLPELIMQADLVVHGRIVHYEPQDVEAVLSTTSPYTLDYRIAVLKVHEVIYGPKDLKEVRLGFVSPDQDRATDKTGKNMPKLVNVNPDFRLVKNGEDGLIFVRKHHQGKFYVNFLFFGGFSHSTDAGFAKHIDKVRRWSKLLSSPVDALKTGNPDNRYLCAVVFVSRYRTKGARTEPIDADVSKLLLKTLAEADWKDVGEAVASSVYPPHPYQVFLKLGVTKADGYDPPRAGSSGFAVGENVSMDT